MSAYLIIQIKADDQDRWPAYGAAIGPLAQRFGGRYLVRGIDVQVLEGIADGRRLVIFEFSSMAALVRFWHSPEYAGLKALREGLAELDVWAVSGAAGGLWA